MIFEKIREKINELTKIAFSDEFERGWASCVGASLHAINQVEAEYKNKNVNIITDYLQYVRDNADNYDTENGWSLADLIDLSIKFSEVAEYNNGWISVDDRLPEEMQRCLVTQRIYVVPDHVDEPDNFIGIKFNTYTKQYGWLSGQEVFAWMPLPEPYKKGE